MQRRSALALLACTVLAACARSAEVRTPPPPPTVDPVGTFDFTTSADGTAVVGFITIAREAAGYVGSINTDVAGMMPLSSVTVDGMSLLIRAEADSPVDVRLDFSNADEFSGGWSYGGMTGTLTGQRRKS